MFTRLRILMLRTFTNREAMTCNSPGRKSVETRENKRKVLKGRHKHTVMRLSSFQD